MTRPGELPTDPPPAASFLLRLNLALIVIVLAAILPIVLAGTFADVRAFLRAHAMLAYPALIAAPVSGFIISSFVATARLDAIAHIARERRGELCYYCMYPMSAEQSQCPECGVAQEFSKTVEAWRRFVRRRRHQGIFREQAEAQRRAAAKGVAPPDEDWP